MTAAFEFQGQQSEQTPLHAAFAKLGIHVCAGEMESRVVSDDSSTRRLVCMAVICGPRAKS